MIFQDTPFPDAVVESPARRIIGGSVARSFTSIGAADTKESSEVASTVNETVENCIMNDFSRCKCKDCGRDEMGSRFLKCKY